MSLGKVRAWPGRPVWVLCVIGLLMAGCGDGEKSSQKNQASAASAKPAQVETVAPMDLTLEREYPAKIRSDLSADIVARVSGVLEKQLYTPGDTVEKGQTLFIIEQAQYKAAVEQARADVESARATLENNRRDYERYNELYKQRSVSQQQRDSALSAYRTARASVAQAQAALDDAQISLDYTTVKAPVSGRVGLNEVNVGNYVAVQTELTTVTPLDPLEVRFALPQSDAFALRRQRTNDPESIKASLEFPYADQSGSTDTSLKGTLNFLGSRVDDTTSTVQARAVFKNPGDLFLPGLFVRVKLLGVKHYSALAVPEVAVTEGLKGPQLYILNDKDVIENRFVSLGEQAGGWVVISDGLAKGDRVVVSAIGSVSPGDKIKPQAFDGQPTTTPTDPSGKNGASTHQAMQGTSISGQDTQKDAPSQQQDQ
ncbi:efflux RND transporter periplasmic adaptor subunit [Larsenimonas rhizosphaerae]|uniref:Efflux RND transporter periplasmic adaptor subunit n=1 Tax=Larsenimonas rhizosphaerae TaxID=2944682 RepID=A0AA42CT08_9GAMM|nr:efflux RND transporter periplasmic adaptor subunit [Larsenimonas rhizosphaerae]MCX2523132.1 efflux RND transporter periplasmic adaptor subunit [Larsenimonas rhizosphaerae]